MKLLLQIAGGVFLAIVLVLVMVNLPAIVDKVTGNDVTRKQEQENSEANQRAIQFDLERRLSDAAIANRHSKK